MHLQAVFVQVYMEVEYFHEFRHDQTKVFFLLMVRRLSNSNFDVLVIKAAQKPVLTFLVSGLL